MFMMTMIDIKHLYAWLVRVVLGLLFLLDFDFTQNRFAFMEDQAFVGSFLCCIFFCMYLGVFYRHRLIELQKDRVQKQYG